MTWKRTPPSVLLRVKHGWTYGVTAFLTLFGLLTGLVGLARTWNGMQIAGAIACLGTVSGVWAWARGKSNPLLPVAFVDELSEEPKFRAGYCTREQLRQACEMTRESYGDQYVAANVAEQWRLRDPKAFVAIENQYGELCACFGVIALAESFADVFREGQCTDATLRGEDVRDSEEAKKSNRLYVSGVVVRGAGAVRGAKRARVMLWALLDYYRRRFGLRKERVLFGLAVTTDSERLMKKLGFHLASPGDGRQDKCNLYEVTMNKTEWQKVLAKVGDLSSMCTVDWGSGMADRQH